MFNCKAKTMTMGILLSVFVFSNTAWTENEWIKPLSIGRSVKLILKNDEQIKGVLKHWDENSILLQTNIGEMKINTENVIEAKYALGYQLKTVKKNVDSGRIKSDGKSAIEVRTPNLNKQKKYEIEKQDWQVRLKNAKTTRVVEIVTGVAVCIGGFYLFVDGQMQRSDPDWEIRGNYITNEDDVNEGNLKVTIGLLTTALGSTLIVLGVVQGNKINDLQYEGEHRGFVINSEISREYSGLRLNYNF